MSSECGSQTKRYAFPRTTLILHVALPVPPTLVALFTPAPLIRKLCSDERSRTDTVYTPARRVRTGAPEAVLSEMVSPGPTVATSRGTAAFPGTANAAAPTTTAAATAGARTRMRFMGVLLRWIACRGGGS